MKKTLLIAACSLMFTGLQAQTTLQQKWAVSVENSVAQYDELNLNAVTAIDNAGNVYSTGNFTQFITIGNAMLDPVANSAYLAKYDAEGNALWAIALRGAAAITSITTDEANNVYIAGQLADAVEVGSTDGNTQTISGKPGEVEAMVSSFIAAFDANGALKATKVIWTELESNMSSDNYWGASAYARINHIKAAGDKLYASARYVGHLTVDNVAWEGSYVDLGGFYMEAVSAGVFSVNAATLGEAESVANVMVTGQYTMGADGAEDIAVTTDGEDVYLCFLGCGNLTYTQADGTSQELTFGMGDAGVEHGYVVSSIKNGSVNSKTFTTTVSGLANYNMIGQLKVEGDLLYLAGRFQEGLAFDNSVVAVDACDLYAVALNKDTFEPQWTAQTGIAEGNGTTNYDYENYSGMTVNNGTVSVYGYTMHSQNAEEEITGTYVYDFSNGTATNSEAPFVTGAASNGTTQALLTADKETLTTTLTVYTVPKGSSIGSVAAMTTQRVGNTFYFAEPADITVYDLQGRALLKANNAASVSIDGLAPGVYILTDGSHSLKAQKGNF